MLYQEVCDMEHENEALKARVKLLEDKLGEDSGDKPYRCRDCKNFVQHYSRTGNMYHPLYCGHCKAGARIKRRVREDESCSYFEKTAMKNVFV